MNRDRIIIFREFQIYVEPEDVAATTKKDRSQVNEN